MALISCPDCGRAVSDQAPACAGCGLPIAGKYIHPSSTRWYHGSGVVVAALLFFFPIGVILLWGAPGARVWVKVVGTALFGFFFFEAALFFLGIAIALLRRFG